MANPYLDLALFKANANVDARTDARVSTYAPSTSISNIYAFDSLVSGTKTSSSTDSALDQSAGFTGKNAQTTLIVVVLAAAGIGAAYLLLK